MQTLGQVLMVAEGVAIPQLVFSVVAIVLMIECCLFGACVNQRQERVIRAALVLYQPDLLLASEKRERDWAVAIASLAPAIATTRR